MAVDAEHARLVRLERALREDFAAFRAVHPNAEIEGLAPEAAQEFRALTQRELELANRLEANKGEIAKLQRDWMEFQNKTT